MVPIIGIGDDQDVNVIPTSTHPLLTRRIRLGSGCPHHDPAGAGVAAVTVRGTRRGSVSREPKGWTHPVP